MTHLENKKSASLPPGDRGLPFIGETLNFLFDPERFSPENMADKQKNFCYVPFGGGLRECLGKEFARLEMKIFASILVRNCHWELLPDQNLDMINIPSPRPTDGLKVKIS